MSAFAVDFVLARVVRLRVQAVEIRLEVIFVHVVGIENVVLVEEVRVNKVVNRSIAGVVKYLKLSLEVDVLEKQIRRLAFLLEVAGIF